MNTTHVPPLKTRQRLLVTASRIFAEKGYQEATVAEICEQAETNIASVNYHFRDKENLYLESWRYAFQQDMERYPSDGGIDPDTAAEVRLAGRIKSLIARIADPESHFFAIVHREMAQQTSLLEKIMAQEINPERQALNILVKELIGSDATEQQVQFCHASIVGQCFHLLKVKHLRLSQETQRYVIDMNDAEAYAEHVVQFSLAGIKAMRETNRHRIGSE
ncbi:CerR family C-terminal domain-containing protein [Methyloglobulus sp.]|uniref:CerR family C-terminal domain-containing protein n=1 Tax=Methyloglobulus sp. TaxID=2518622 RepID=UPI0032B78999